MALSSEEKQRIREEELVRLQAREEFRVTKQAAQSRDIEQLLAVSLAFVVALVALFMMLAKTDRPTSAELAPAAQEHNSIRASVR